VAQSALIDAVRGDTVEDGVSARELLERGANQEVSASALERWLLDEGLAIEIDGRLLPTARARRRPGPRLPGLRRTTLDDFGEVREDDVSAEATGRPSCAFGKTLEST
jgi:hypothetical protein